MVAGTAGVVLSMPTIGAGAGASSAVLTTVGLFLFGLGMGGGEIAMNVEGADIEKAIRRPVLPALHGFFSVGTVLGASVGILFTALDVPVVWHLVSIGAIAVVVLVVASRSIPGGTGRVDRQHAAHDTSGVAAPPSGRTPASCLSRRSSWRWHWPRARPETGSRWSWSTGTALVQPPGRPSTRSSPRRSAWLLSSSSTASGSPPSRWCYGDWGPRWASPSPSPRPGSRERTPRAARRVSLAVTVGYVAFLVGPPVIGFVGEHYGLRAALTLPLILVAASTFLASAVQERDDATAPADELVGRG